MTVRSARLLLLPQVCDLFAPLLGDRECSPLLNVSVELVSLKFGKGRGYLVKRVFMPADCGRVGIFVKKASFL